MLIVHWAAIQLLHYYTIAVRTTYYILVNTLNRWSVSNQHTRTLLHSTYYFTISICTTISRELHYLYFYYLNNNIYLAIVNTFTLLRPFLVLCTFAGFAPLTYVTLLRRFTWGCFCRWFDLLHCLHLRRLCGFRWCFPVQKQV